MFPPKSRLTAALVAAVALLAAPARSEAAVGILVEEIDAGGNTLETATFAGGVFSTTSFGQIGVTAASNSSLVLPNASIATGISFLNNNAIPASSVAGIGLRITITDTFTRGVGGNPATLKTSIGGANGSQDFEGDLGVGSQTSVLGPNGATTPLASVVSPNGASSGPQQVGIPALDQTFQLQQVITIRVTAGSSGKDVPEGQSFAVSVGSSTTPLAAPVPAPAGLALALVGLPLLGLRRVLRKKVTA